MRTSAPLALLVALSASVACAHVTSVQVDALQPRYAHPESKLVASAPLAVVYDPRELPDDVSLAVPNGFPSSTVHHARSLVTKHLRAALQTVFERVDIVEDPSLAHPG